jgi:hypothetical protein
VGGRRCGGGWWRGSRWGGVAVTWPSGARVSCQPPSWIARCWARQTRARLSRSVGPPSSQCWRWWPSHQARGRRPAAGAAPHQTGAAGLPPEPGGPARPGHRRGAAPRSGVRRRWPDGGQGLQGGQQGLAGLWVQQALQGDHAFPGRGRPQPPPLAAAAWLRRSRWRSQLAVEAAGTPGSAPAAPRLSMAARSPSQWPSKRSSSRRSRRVPWVRAGSVRRSRSWVVRVSTRARGRPEGRVNRPAAGRCTGANRCSVHGGNLSSPHPKASTKPKL